MRQPLFQFSQHVKVRGTQNMMPKVTTLYCLLYLLLLNRQSLWKWSWHLNRDLCLLSVFTRLLTNDHALQIFLVYLCLYLGLLTSLLVFLFTLKVVYLHVQSFQTALDVVHLNVVSVACNP